MKLTNGLAVILTVAFLALVGGVVVITLTGKDAVGFVGLIGTLLTSIAGFIVLLSNQHAQNGEIATVKGQTNGTLTKLLALNSSKDMQLKAALAYLTPDQAQEVLGTTLSKDQVVQAVQAATGTPIDASGTGVTVNG